MKIAGKIKQWGILGVILSLLTTGANAELVDSQSQMLGALSQWVPSGITLVILVCAFLGLVSLVNYFVLSKRVKNKAGLAFASLATWLGLTNAILFVAVLFGAFNFNDPFGITQACWLLGLLVLCVAFCALAFVMMGDVADHNDISIGHLFLGD